MTILNRGTAVAVPIVGRSPRHDLECGYDEGWRGDPDEHIPNRETTTYCRETCADCGDNLQSGAEQADGVCITCRRDRTGR